MSQYLFENIQCNSRISNSTPLECAVLLPNYQQDDQIVPETIDASLFCSNFSGLTNKCQRSLTQS